MTGTGPTGEPGTDDDGFDAAGPDAAWLTALLTDLADDPDAPPSTVTPLSVIAAARRAAAESPAAAVDTPVTAGAPVDTDDAELPAPTELRSHRRRRVLGSLLAAACLVGGALIVVPLAVNSNSSTTSSSAVNSEQVAAGNAAPAPQSLASLAELPGDAEGSPTDPERADSGSAAGSFPAAPSAPVPSAAADSAAAADSGVLPGCWPLLDEAATAALIAAVPEFAFGQTAALTDPCDAAAVAGLTLSSAAGVPDLLVRVTTAEPGACVSVDDGCEPADGGGFLGVDASGAPVAYVYANGLQIAVVAPQPPAGSGLTTAQAMAAAKAVAATVTG